MQLFTMLYMKKLKINYVLAIFLLLTMMLQGQDNNNKWAVSIGGGILNYSRKHIPVLGYRYVETIPRFTIARYVAKNFTIAGSFSVPVSKSPRYEAVRTREEFEFQWDARYDFGTSENIFSPYVLVGGTLIEKGEPEIAGTDIKIQTGVVGVTTTLNLGIGATLWVYRRFGVNAQVMQRFNYAAVETQPSHQFFSAGIVYRFNLRGANGRRRLWNVKH